MSREKLIDFITFYLAGLIQFCTIVFTITFSIVFVMSSIDFVIDVYNHFFSNYLI